MSYDKANIFFAIDECIETYEHRIANFDSNKKSNLNDLGGDIYRMVVSDLELLKEHYLTWAKDKPITHHYE